MSDEHTEKASIALARLMVDEPLLFIELYQLAALVTNSAGPVHYEYLVALDQVQRTIHDKVGQL